MKPLYRIYTYDPMKEAFTPQSGVRSGPYSLFGLRKALRALQNLGYPCDRHDPSVLVERHPDVLVEQGIATTTCKCRNCQAAMKGG
jgi:hypothetical protein